MVGNSPVKLSRFTGRADNQPLPVGNQLRFGDDGHPAEVFKIGGGDKLIEVLEAQLVLGQDDDVLGEAVGLAALGTQGQHLFIDLL